MSPAVRIQLVEDREGARIAAAVADRVWSMTAMVPTEIVIAAVHAGGYASVLWEDGDPVGSAFGFLGHFHDGRASLHSHLAGVVAERAGRGHGEALKRHQWRWAHERGLEAITWTFDPLVRRNAWFNLATLGCEVEGYHTDFYGRLVDDINSDGSSDRLVVRWAVAGRGEAPVGRRVEVRAGDLTIPTPDDVGALRAGDPGAVAAWRALHREAFGAALGAGRVVRGVTDRGDYVVGAP